MCGVIPPVSLTSSWLVHGQLLDAFLTLSMFFFSAYAQDTLQSEGLLCPLYSILTVPTFARQMFLRVLHDTGAPNSEK